MQTVTAIETNHLLNTAIIKAKSGTKEIKIKMSLLDFDHILIELNNGRDLQRKTLSKDELSKSSRSALIIPRLLMASVDLRVDGKIDYIDLRLNKQRPDEARFALSPIEAERLGAMLIKEARLLDK